jgi:hypothetical protein
LARLGPCQQSGQRRAQTHGEGQDPRAYAPLRTSMRACGEGHADPAEPDLVRARVVDGRRSAPASRRRGRRGRRPLRENECATRVPAGRETTLPRWISTFSSPSVTFPILRGRRRALLCGMAVRRISLAARRDGHVAEAGLDRPDHDHRG